MTKIWDLFVGYDKAHGRFEVKRTNEKGKVEGRAITVRGPVTQEMWEQHLAGKGPGIGIISLLVDNTILWGCIDIDLDFMKPDTHDEIEKKIKALKLPLVMARSKSGTAHCFVFFTEPAPAAAARSAMERWAAAMGYGGCEVFPKQTSRFDQENDLGNWLNMPYFYQERTLRYGILDGKHLTLDEFVAHAVRSKIDPASLEQPEGTVSAASVDYPEGPPCLQHLQSTGGFPEGTRNDGMYNVAVYLRKKYPDDWQNRIQEYNLKMCTPALSLNELNVLVKSVNKKSYTYRCKLAPIAQHCQRSICLTRACGVGETTESAGLPEIGNLVKYNGDPVLWFLDIDGKRMMLTSDELLNQGLFKKRVLDIVTRVPATIPAPRWFKFIDDKVKNCEILEVPIEASSTGQFRLLVTQYVTGQAQATSKEELAHRMTPFKVGDGTVWFRSRGLLEYLSRHGFKIKSEHHAWQMLREMGAKSEFVNIKGKGCNVWIIPEPEHTKDDSPIPEFGTQEF